MRIFSDFGHNIDTKYAPSAVAIMPHLEYNISVPHSGVLLRWNETGCRLGRGAGMNFVLALIMIFSLICGGYLFLIAPNIRKRKICLPADFFRPYAHRGLHDGNNCIVENSLPAFRLAMEKGYGIELDVRLTRDGQMVIHHDDSLLRLCGTEQKISALMLDQVQKFCLGQTDEKIPLLEDVLSLIDGRVPLILELKPEPFGNTQLAEMVHKRMQDYQGVYCVESFDPLQMHWYKKHAPLVIRGQLAYDPAKYGDDPRKKSIVRRLSAHLVFNFLSRPDFVAYGHETDKNFSFRVMRNLFRPLLAAWTVRSIEDFKRLQDQYDLQIFEDFEP